ncbi:hypothetical protein CHUAL_000263 [Chamberlinius hualienensis]
MKDAVENSAVSKSGGSDSGVVVQPELSYNYPDLVGQRQSNIQTEKNNVSMRPLCEESLKMSGIKVPSDFPMIDDEEGEEISTANVNKTVNDDVTNAKPDLVEATVLIKAKTVAVDSLSTVNGPSSSFNSLPTVLKSALKKPNVVSTKKKGLRVSFHDTRVFYIDTEAEANAEPQLLTVHSLDLPLAPTDFRVFIPAYDFLPPAHVPINTKTGLKPGVDRAYTYEDAIVSISNFVEQVNNEDDDDDDSGGEDEEYLAFTEASKSSSSNTNNDYEEISPNFIEQPPAAVQSEVSSANETTAVVDQNQRIAVDKTSETVDDTSVRCLTEANLREHEMKLMEQEVFEQSRVNEDDVETEIQSAAGKSVHPVISNEKTLSPPLKELMVDVSVLTPGGVGASSGHSGLNGGHEDWQVELSPLNSIPGDSETESSTSSQDTIIMMTSEESERNENRIKQSQKTFKQKAKKDFSENSRLFSAETSGNGSVGSQDSDETLKFEGNYQLSASIPNLDVEGNLIRSNAAFIPSASAAQKTSSQIRQLMERNAMRRNLMRYSNTRLKKGVSTNGDIPNDIEPIERQRQWRSHESLLDTIKKLTLEESAGQQLNENDNKERDYVHHHPSPVANGYSNSQNHIDDSSYRGKNLNNGNLNLQDKRPIVNGANYTNELPKSNGTGNLIKMVSSAPTEPVPGDLRQWKIRSNQWQVAHNSIAAINNHERYLNGNAGNVYNRSTSMDTLQMPLTPIPLIKNGMARCATLKEQYNNKDFYRVSLSHTYSQSDDHLEMSNDDEIVDEEAEDLSGEVPDELSQFVQMDSGRIERLRKRYSYSDMDNYANAVNAFNRRSSVRGIKPRFGSTSEILKQMQSQLQPPPLANHRNSSSHMTWPYPANNGSDIYDNSIRSDLPVVQEEIYGSTRPQQPSRNINMSIYASIAEMKPLTRPPQQLLQPNSNRSPGRTVTQVLPNSTIHKQPPPYQPPPSPSMTFSQRNHLPIPGNNLTPTTSPLKIHTKDERGVPEGASSSPKVLTDSLRQHHSSPSQSFVGNTPTTVNNGSIQPLENNEKSHGNNGVVYYVMQV